MPLKQFEKNPQIDEFAKTTESSNTRLKKAAIFRVNEQGLILSSSAGVFLLNPAAIEESKSANWNAKNIPGQSDPVLQWSSSGARKITFDALVTADTSQFDDGQTRRPGEDSSGSGILNKISSAASAFFNIDTPPAPSELKIDGKGDKLDISRHLNYYRSLLYPVYDDINNPKKLNQSPPLVVLYFGRSIITKKYDRRISNNHEVWVVTGLRIRVTKQLPNLAPMEAVVSFSLTQYNIKSFDTRRFLR